MDKRYGAHIFGEFYAHMNDLAGFAPTLMYSFGWSSLLSITARRAAARELYKSLLALIKYMQSQGLEPRIRLLAFSHGGNVALYLAEAARAYAHTPFVIEEFILISTPVQPDTDLYLKSKIFKKIYLFYSVGDNIQSSDFLSSSEHVFARHFFVDRRTSELPACVTQIQVRFIRKKFVMTKKDGTEKVFYRRDLIQPNHTEMYFFGWTPEWYRRYFPIKPLPVILLIPIIMRALEKNHICCNRIRVTIIPEESRMEIYVKATDTKIEVPFLPRPLLDEIRQDLWKLQPTNMNEYRWRMKEHWKHAQAIVREEYRAKSRPSKYRMRSAHKKTT